MKIKAALSPQNPYKMKKTTCIFFLSAAVFLTLSHAFAASQAVDAQEVYERKCARCHGDDGTPKKRNVPNLKKSDLSDAAAIDLITNGEDKMPAFAKKLSAQEIKAVAIYIKGFRK